MNSLGSFESTQVRLTLPRFSVEFMDSLTDTLRALGITSIFDEEGTLDGMSTSSNLKVSDVIHKAVLEVGCIPSVPCRSAADWPLAAGLVPQSA